MIKFKEQGLKPLGTDFNLYKYIYREVLTMHRSDAEVFLKERILSSKEVQEILKIDRKRLAFMVKTQKILPIRSLSNDSLYWRDDIEEIREKMLHDPRTNLYKESVKDE